MTFSLYQILPVKSYNWFDHPEHVRVFQRLGGGGDTTTLSPGRSPKQPLPGIGLHDPLHGRQACPKFNSFHEGVGQISPREVLF